MANLKHQDIIDEFYRLAKLKFEWMDDEMMEKIEEVTGITPEKLNSDIETGVRNGISPSLQLVLMKQLLHSMES
ncbi:hypothetical protein NVP1225O_18 [Vibrio phage 1.225.O._10N.261.48.B7]|nr:hypothetical protein NVP1225O_18 [Vibrio phage 1.225.O._10N.261.48.B7]